MVSNIVLEEWKVPAIDDLYMGMLLLKRERGEYWPTNRFNFYPYILSEQDLKEIKIWLDSEQDPLTSQGLPADFFRIPK